MVGSPLCAARAAPATAATSTSRLIANLLKPLSKPARIFIPCFMYIVFLYRNTKKLTTPSQRQIAGFVEIYCGKMHHSTGLLDMRDPVLYLVEITVDISPFEVSAAALQVVVYFEICADQLKYNRSMIRDAEFHYCPCQGPNLAIPIPITMEQTRKDSNCGA